MMISCWIFRLDRAFLRFLWWQMWLRLRQLLISAATIGLIELMAHFSCIFVWLWLNSLSPVYIVTDYISLDSVALFCLTVASERADLALEVNLLPFVNFAAACVRAASAPVVVSCALQPGGVSAREGGPKSDPKGKLSKAAPSALFSAQCGWPRRFAKHAWKDPPNSTRLFICLSNERKFARKILAKDY